MTPLAERLAATIRANGPMTVADYMAACLGDPRHGYYMRREPFGRGGDFITAPEVSQVFGELIGAWAVAAWEAMGSPGRFVLAELGPGRGTLMADLLRVAALRPAFMEAAAIHLVDTSPRLRKAQEATLGDHAARVTWHDGVEGLPPGPLLLIANEFFDALPIHQFVRTPDGWAERMVGVGMDGGLAWGLRRVPETSFRRKPESIRGGPSKATGNEHVPGGMRWTPAFAGVTETGETVPAGAVVEVSPAAAAIMAGLAERLARKGGAALVIDYGYAGPAFGDTLQALRNQGHDDPLAAPGEADLTAHVDFGALAAAAQATGATPRALMTQGEFLLRLGLAERAARLAADRDEATRAGIAAAVARLSDPKAMGDLFKVLAVSSPGLALPVFDDDASR